MKTGRGIAQKVAQAIAILGCGAVFVPKNFLHLGNRQAIDITLHRLAQQGIIRRLARGIYDVPEEHPVLGKLPPPPERIAEALADRDCIRIQPTGSYAANILGLSEQVPGKIAFLTEGPSRTIKVGKTTIQLRQTTAKNMAMAGKLSGLLVQAFRELGKDNITKARIEHLKRFLPLDKRKEILTDIQLVPTWMHSIFIELAEEN